MSATSFSTASPTSTAPIAPEVLLYHRVAEGSLDNQYLSVSPANFEAHLDILCHERKVMPLFDLVQAGLKGHLPEGGVAITFDDGYADNLLNALPLLEKYHCHATIFVTAGLLGHPYGFWYDVLEDVLLGQRDLPPTLQVPLLNEALPLTSPEEILGTHEVLLELCKKAPVRMRRVLLHEVVRAVGLDPAAYSSPHPLLTQEQVAELAASPWIEIGAHTMTHAVLSGLDEAGQRREIVDSVRTLEGIIGKPVRILAYPFGNRGAYNDVTKKVTREEGLLGIANIQGSLALGAGEPNTPNTLNTLDPQDVSRRLVRNWAGADFRRWLRAADRHQLERETVGGRADMLLDHVRRVRRVQDAAVPADVSLADEVFRTEPLSRVFGLDRPGGKPLDRVYIERFLAAEAAHIRGRVMEVAADTYTQKFGRGVTRCDILHAQSTPEATLVGDLATGEGIPCAAFDCIILTQTVQFIYDVQAALRYATAALAPGGVLLLTASGISQISRYDMDRWGEFWRFTDKALLRMLREAAPECAVEVQAFGNAGIARAFLDGRSAVEVPPTAFDHNDPDYQVTLCARVTRPREVQKSVVSTAQCAHALPARIPSVLAPSAEAILEHIIPVRDLVEGYAGLNTDVAQEFEGIPHIGMYRCEETDIIQFSPVVCGTDRLYQQLQQHPWYYLEDKSEYDVAAQYIPADAQVLELGCGRGHFAQKIPLMHFTGLEMNPDALEECCSKGLRVLSDGVEEHAGIHAGFYDAVCAFQVLEHVPAVHKVLEALVQCLKPGGVLIFSLPSNDSFAQLVPRYTLNMPPHHMTQWSDAAVLSVGGLFDLKLVELHRDSLQPEHYNFYATSVARHMACRDLGLSHVTLSQKAYAQVDSYSQRFLPAMLKKVVREYKHLRGLCVTAIFRKI